MNLNKELLNFLDFLIEKKIIQEPILDKNVLIDSYFKKEEN